MAYFGSSWVVRENCKSKVFQDQALKTIYQVIINSSAKADARGVLNCTLKLRGIIQDEKVSFVN